MSNGPSRNQARGDGFQTSFPDAGAGAGLPQVLHYGPVYNIGMAGNVSTSTNYGSIIMNSDRDEFILLLRIRLKASVKADHRYFPDLGNEKALRRSSCTPGTRVAIIEFIYRWGADMSLECPSLYWLSGQGGAGKTTIAYTICHLFDTLISQGHSGVVLGGSFFCSRQFPDTRSTSAIIRTIVYQLALRSQSFQASLKQHGKFENVDHSPRSQLMGLLIGPWRMSAPERLANTEPCYIITIDALDELEAESGSEFLGTLVDVLAKEDLSGLKFFVTSRSDPSLVKRITSFPHKQVCRLEEVPLEESSADIELYLNENLAESATKQQIQQLVSDSAGLFIYAATVVEYIKGRGVEEQKSLLKRLLSPSSSSRRRPSRGATATLDSLYLQILETSLVDTRDLEDPDVFDDCLSILHTFLCTIERTSTTLAVALLNASLSVDDSDMALDTGMAEGVLHRLHAVLFSQAGKVMWFHKSFVDFLFDKRRSQRFFCDKEQNHQHLTDACFRIMNDQLRFNIADIPSSYQLDSDDETLSSRINVNLSRALRYACRHWSAHIVLTSLTALEPIAKILDEFLQLRILFWMESMSLLGQRGLCLAILRDAQRWFLKSKVVLGMVGKLADAAAFAAYHSTSKAALSTPHLYVSSLATFSRHSPIVQSWRRQLGGTPEFFSAQGVGGEAMVACISTGQEVLALALSPDGDGVAVGSTQGLVRIFHLPTGEEVKVFAGHTEEVYGLVYSPDGTHIVSGSKDKSVRVWDLSSGDAKVLNGHTDRVKAVAYSPDGANVVSASYDHSVRVWDPSTGENIKILNGHSSLVVAVAYSPKGTHIVSGSFGDSIRVWDLSTGEAAVLHIHDRGVLAVAYSPDGTGLVTASDDLSVRVWDLVAMREVRVLSGHTSRILTVAFAPDGAHVSSGSTDNSLRVWNWSTGEQVRVLNGHTGRVNAVTYSPDGTHAISGSKDKTIGVWDLTIEDKAKILEGHTGMINAVAHSPDGTHVVSGGSGDKTIRIWDLRTEQEVRILEGHTQIIWSVAYSSDGRYIVSGSSDASVRIWDSCTGQEVRVFEGHTGWVLAVACSPNGNSVASGSQDNTVRVWDPPTGEARVLKGHTNAVTSVAFSHDGARIFSGSRDKLVRVWDLHTGKPVRVLEGHTSWVLAVSCSPDGIHVASGSDDASIRVWDSVTGEMLRVFEGHTKAVWAVAYSPDGTKLVSGSHDGSVRTWDLSTGAGAGVFHGHFGIVMAVAYSPDGTQVVSGSRDRVVRVWNVSPEYRPRYARQKDSQGGYTGWLVSPTESSAHLMFVPPQARLPDDSNVLALPTLAVSHVDFSKAKLGIRWTECYTPTSL